jgi:hypothetical protein
VAVVPLKESALQAIGLQGVCIKNPVIPLAGSSLTLKSLDYLLLL